MFFTGIIFQNKFKGLHVNSCTELEWNMSFRELNDNCVTQKPIVNNFLLNFIPVLGFLKQMEPHTGKHFLEPVAVTTILQKKEEKY